MVFRIDRNLNYGRDIIKDFSSSLKNISNCLDVGAGSGVDLSLIRENHPTIACYAVESWEPNVRALKMNNVEVTAMDFEKEKLPYNDVMFDLVISNQVVEHTKEIFWTIHEITRTLKVGGHFLIGIPNLASFHNRLLLLFGKQPTCIQNSSAHIRGFTASDLKKFLEIFPEGYKLKRFSGSNFYPFPALLAKPLAKIFPSMAWSNFFLFEKVKEYKEPFYIQHPILSKLETNFKCS